MCPFLIFWHFTTQYISSVTSGCPSTGAEISEVSESQTAEQKHYPVATKQLKVIVLAVAPDLSKV